MDYKFEWLNGGAVIENPTVKWTFAGFDIDGKGLLSIDVQLKTDSAIFGVRLETEGQANDRSDEAITGLMNQLLIPYQVDPA